MTAILDFVHRRGSSNDLDDQIPHACRQRLHGARRQLLLHPLHYLGYSHPGLPRHCLGITQSIANVTPETLEKNLDKVTGGLALAFDATALGLGLTMLTMFLTFSVERLEQGVVQTVDRYADDQLAHRFERTGAEGGEFVEVVRQNTQVLVKATEQLVQRQAAVWAQTLEARDSGSAERSGRDEQQERLTAALEAALERTLASHAQRLAALEKQTMDQSAVLGQRLGELAAAGGDTRRDQGVGL